MVTRQLPEPTPMRRMRRSSCSRRETDIPIGPVARRQAPSARRGRLARAVDGDRLRPRAPEELPPDARRGHRRADRPAGSASATSGSPTSRPATTSASTSTRRSSPSIPEYIAKWGTHPSWSRLLGQPADVRGHRGADDRAPRLRGRPAVPDDHPHPHVGDPGARRRGHDLHGRPRPQDDLRRLLVRAGLTAPRCGGSATTTSEHLAELLRGLRSRRCRA